MEAKRSSMEELTESLMATEFEARADREPKSKLREEVLEEGFDAAIGADLPWGLNPNSLVKRPSKSFIVRTVQAKLEREREGSGAVVFSVYGGSAGECGEGRMNLTEDYNVTCIPL